MIVAVFDSMYENETASVYTVNYSFATFGQFSHCCYILTIIKAFGAHMFEHVAEL